MSALHSLDGAETNTLLQSGLTSGMAGWRIGLAAAVACLLVVGSSSRPIATPPMTQDLVDFATSLLWPGTLEYETGTSPDSLQFVASGRRYYATTSSAGFAIHDPESSSESIGIVFAGARAGLPAVPDVSGLHRLSVLGGPRQAHSIDRVGRGQFRHIYPGVDVQYRVTDGNLEFDFLVAPGAAADNIALAPGEGTTFKEDASTGDILAVHASHVYRIKRPMAFQDIDGTRREVSVRFDLRKQSLRFELGQYDDRHELVIDPLVTTYSSYIGTTTDAGYDVVDALAVDADGNTYIAGMTAYDLNLLRGAPFFRTPGSVFVPDPLDENIGCRGHCGYVVKLNSRSEIVYSTLMYRLDIRDIAVDAAQNVYLTGRSDEAHYFPWNHSTFDILSNPPTGNFFTPGAVAVKLNSAGTHLDYAYMLAGQVGVGIAVDETGAAYVAGTIQSGGLKTTPGSLKPDYQDIGPDRSNADGFLLKISPDGGSLVYGTYLGGSGDDAPYDIALGAAGNVLVAGRTESSDITGFAAPLNGAADAFILEMSADGSRVIRGRVFGGASGEHVEAITSDHRGGYLIAGVTVSEDFPVTTGAVQTHLLGTHDGWLQGLDSNLAVRYSTYFGGSHMDGVLAVDADDDGNAYFAGLGFSADFLTTTSAFQDVTTAVSTDYLAAAGSQFYKFSTDPVPREAYVGVLSQDGRTLRYGTYLGGYFTGGPFPLSMANAVVHHADGRVVAAGSTTAYSFPVTDGGLQDDFPVSPGGFVLELEPSDFHITTGSQLPSADWLSSTPYEPLQLAASGGTSPYAWSVVGFRLPPGFTLSSTGVISGRWVWEQGPNGESLNETGAYQFTVKATDAAGRVAYKNFFMPGESRPIHSCSNSTCVMNTDLHASVGFRAPVPVRAVPPLTVQVSGNIPSGVFLEANQRLTGYARPAGRYQFQLTTTDSTGRSVTMGWDLTINDPNAPPPPPPPPPPPMENPPDSPSSGGGGAIGLLLLAGLLVLGTWRGQRTRRRA